MTMARNDRSAARTGDDPWPGADDLPDLTDRRRVLLMFLFGIPVSASAADAVFRCHPVASCEHLGAQPEHESR